MSVPPELLAKMQGGGGQAAPSPTPMPGGGMPGPGGTPMSGPTKKEGNKEVAKVQVHIAMNMLEQALTAFGAESKEGKSVLKVLGGLSKDLGESDSSDLVPAQIMEMVKGTPQMGGGNEMQQQLMKMMQQQKQGGQPQPQQPQQPRLM